MVDLRRIFFKRTKKHRKGNPNYCLKRLFKIHANVHFEYQMRRLYDRIHLQIDSQSARMDWSELHEESHRVRRLEFATLNFTSQGFELAPDSSKLLLQSLANGAFVFEMDSLFTQSPFYFRSFKLPNYGHSCFSFCGDFLATTSTRGSIQVWSLAVPSKRFAEDVMISDWEQSQVGADMLDPEFIKSFPNSNLMGPDARKTPGEGSTERGPNALVRIENAHVLDINDFTFFKNQNHKYLPSISDDRFAHFWKLA